MNPAGKPAYVARAVPDRLAELYYNIDIMSEYDEVLSRDKFGFDNSKVAALMGNIEEFGHILTPKPSSVLVMDETDRIFYDTAKEAGAYLVTGNSKHYPQPLEPFILKPAALLELLDTIKLEM